MTETASALRLTGFNQRALSHCLASNLISPTVPVRLMLLQFCHHRTGEHAEKGTPVTHDFAAPGTLQTENGEVMPRRFRRVGEVVIYQVMTVENRKPWPCASRVLEPARPLGLEVPRAPVWKSKPP
jgi:hypothetical protein